MAAQRVAAVAVLLAVAGVCGATLTRPQSPKPMDTVPPVPEEVKLEVFIMPHTHDDVGWLHTVDVSSLGAWHSAARLERAFSGVSLRLHSLLCAAVPRSFCLVPLGIGVLF